MAIKASRVGSLFPAKYWCITVAEKPHCKAKARALPFPMANLSLSGKLPISSVKFNMSKWHLLKIIYRILNNKLLLDNVRNNVYL